MNKEQIWKPIKDFPNYSISYNGIVMNTATNRVVKGCIIKFPNTNYRNLKLRNDKKRYTLKLHRVLAIAFIPNPDNLPFIDHIDGNGLNNHLDNLRWCSNSDNNQNKEVQKNNKLGIKNINYDSKQNRYTFQKKYRKKLFQKYFKTLEEAIECKNEWYDNHKDEFMVKNKRVKVNV